MLLMPCSMVMAQGAGSCCCPGHAADGVVELLCKGSSSAQAYAVQ